jgi:general nucleoside transport system permease protein
MDLILVIASGVATGTVLLYATIGEIFSERSGILNLGVEGMMLIGAMSAYKVAAATNNAWIGLLVAMLAAGLVSQVHAFISITLQADQVVSGLALNFLATGISLVLGEGLTSLRDVVPQLPSYTIPLLSQIPLLGRIFFENHSIMVYIGYLFVPLAWYYINRTRPGLHLRSVGEYPAAADTLGIRVFSLRYFYVFIGGLLAGVGGATISLSISPGWFGSLTTSGQGWIAIGLVIFAQWNPVRAVFGAYTFGALRRLVLDVQGPLVIFGVANPFFYNPNLSFFLKMLPYVFTVIFLVIGSREANRKRIGTPAALGLPYIRGQRGL